MRFCKKIGLFWLPAVAWKNEWICLTRRSVTGQLLWWGHTWLQSFNMDMCIPTMQFSPWGHSLFWMNGEFRGLFYSWWICNKSCFSLRWEGHFYSVVVAHWALFFSKMGPGIKWSQRRRKCEKNGAKFCPWNGSITTLNVYTKNPNDFVKKKFSLYDVSSTFPHSHIITYYDLIISPFKCLLQSPKSSSLKWWTHKKPSTFSNLALRQSDAQKSRSRLAFIHKSWSI